MIRSYIKKIPCQRFNVNKPEKALFSSVSYLVLDAIENLKFGKYNKLKFFMFVELLIKEYSAENTNLLRIPIRAVASNLEICETTVKHYRNILKDLGMINIYNFFTHFNGPRYKVSVTNAYNLFAYFAAMNKGSDIYEKTDKEFKSYGLDIFFIINNYVSNRKEFNTKKHDAIEIGSTIDPPDPTRIFLFGR
jgi:hypothetical protein